MCAVICFKVVKVADFGVARFQNNGGVMTAETGTYRWMAPEVHPFSIVERIEKICIRRTYMLQMCRDVLEHLLIKMWVILHYRKTDVVQLLMEMLVLLWFYCIPSLISQFLLGILFVL